MQSLVCLHAKQYDDEMLEAPLLSEAVLFLDPLFLDPVFLDPVFLDPLGSIDFILVEDVEDVELKGAVVTTDLLASSKIKYKYFNVSARK